MDLRFIYKTVLMDYGVNILAISKMDVFKYFVKEEVLINVCCYIANAIIKEKDQKFVPIHPT